MSTDTPKPSPDARAAQQAAFRAAQQALQTRTQPSPPAAPPANALASVAEDDDPNMPLVPGTTGALVSADTLDAARAVLTEPQRVCEIVRYTYVAPDPFEGFPAERAHALAPLLSGGEQGFGLSRLPSEFHRLDGNAKLDYLLDLPDPALTLQALPAEEFVFLLKDVGLSDAGSLLSLATPHQMQTLVDLEVWDADEIDRLRFAHLLALALDAGAETTERFVAAQEDGLLCHFVSGSARVYESAEEAEEELPEDWEQFIAPDGTMVVGLPFGDEAVGPIRALLDAIFRVDIERGRRVLRATRWELRMSMQEDLYETRNKRVAGHGFPARDEAQEIYRFVSPAEAKAHALELLAGEGADEGAAVPFVPEALSARTDLVLHGLHGAPFLARAVTHCTGEERERLQLGLVHLAYHLQAARAARPSETAELPRWTRHAILTADMGLDWLADGDVERGAALLRVMPLRELFGVGHSLVVVLHHRAVRLRRRLGGQLDAVGPELAPMVAALCQPLPERPEPRAPQTAPPVGIPEDVDQDAPTPPSTRPYERLSELSEARALLAGLETAVDVVERLGDAPLATVLSRLAIDMSGDSGDALTLTSLLASAIAWSVLEGQAKVAVIPMDDARRFLVTAFEGPTGYRKVKGELRNALSRALLANPALNDADLGPMEGLLNRTLTRLDTELGGLDPTGPLDARFIGAALAIAAD